MSTEHPTQVYGLPRAVEQTFEFCLSFIGRGYASVPSELVLERAMNLRRSEGGWTAERSAQVRAVICEATLEAIAPDQVDRQWVEVLIQRCDPALWSLAQAREVFRRGRNAASWTNNHPRLFSDFGDSSGIEDALGQAEWALRVLPPASYTVFVETLLRGLRMLDDYPAEPLALPLPSFLERWFAVCDFRKTNNPVGLLAEQTWHTWLAHVWGTTTLCEELVFAKAAILAIARAIPLPRGQKRRVRHDQWVEASDIGDIDALTRMVLTKAMPEADCLYPLFAASYLQRWGSLSSALPIYLYEARGRTPDMSIEQCVAELLAALLDFTEELAYHE